MRFSMLAALFLLFPSFVIAADAPPTSPSSTQAEMMGRVEWVLLHGFSGFSGFIARRSIEWGDVQEDKDGNRSIRYKFYATRWDRDVILMNLMFSFDAKGNPISIKTVDGFPKNETSLGDDDIDPATIEVINRKITANVPSNWICERGQTGLVLRRTEEPVIINITSGSGPRQGETWEEYRQKSAVNIKYRIILRLGRKVKPAQVQKMIAENHQIQREIDSVKKTLRWGKGTPQPPRTPEEQVNQAKYYQLIQSLKPIPGGYLGDVSVYIEPTKLGFVLSDTTKAECEMVIKRVADSLTRYPTEPEESAAKQ